MRAPYRLLSPTDRLQRHLTDGSAIPSGTYTVTRTLTLTAQEGAIVRTTGRRVTLGWEGPKAGPMFQVDDCAIPSFRDLNVFVVRPLDVFMLVRRTRTGLQRPATGLHLRDIKVYGQDPWHLQDGVVFGAVGLDANNEHAAFERVEIYNAMGDTVRIAHKQSKEHYFEKCHFGTDAAAATGVASVSGFYWDKGTMYGMAVPFRLVGGGGDRVSVRDSSFEKCKRVLVQEHRTSDPWQILLDGVTFRADQLHPDGEWVTLHNAGPLVAVNCQVGAGDMPLIPLIGLHGPTGTVTNIRLGGNSFDAWGADQVCPVRTDGEARCVVDWGLNTYTRGKALDPRTVVIGDWTDVAVKARP